MIEEKLDIILSRLHDLSYTIGEYLDPENYTRIDGVIQIGDYYISLDQISCITPVDDHFYTVIFAGGEIKVQDREPHEIEFFQCDSMPHSHLINIWMQWKRKTTV